jgi:hypothetical protein
MLHDGHRGTDATAILHRAEYTAEEEDSRTRPAAGWLQSQRSGEAIDSMCFSSTGSTWLREKQPFTVAS